ncbi:Fur family transcriptional regulator [Oleidesulfovibrio sp.]|uniref:Fur family transcriptional regulator n=1 Tax=Oleidesulfovibrio sp. TaxID=2909707 RepID=UPI003A85A091
MNKPDIGKNIYSSLAEAGLEATPNRILALQTLQHMAYAASVQEVLDALPSGAMDRVTLYRTLDALAAKGVISKTSAADRSFRYCSSPGKGTTPHCHFYCRNCGKMHCLPPAALNTWMQKTATEHGVLVERVELRLDGLCAICRNSQ